MKIIILAAISQNNIIGKDNALPWKLSSDLKRFKELTTGKAIVMGRKTYESIGKPLPNRVNVVLSRTGDIKTENGHPKVMRSPEEVLEYLKYHEEIFIIGGRDIYELFLPHASKMIITKVLADVEGDVEFPEIDMSKWDLVYYDFHWNDEKNQYPFAFTEYLRKRK